MSAPRRRAGAVPGLCLLPGLALLVTGCAAPREAALPDSPSATWTVPAAVREDVRVTLDAAGRTPLPGQDALPALQPGRAYGLPALIDYAQRRNPATRAAWEAARQAALETGVAESTLLPRLAASVVGGWQRLSTPISVPVAGRVDVTEDATAVVPMLTAEWLLFDFGEREAAIEASRQLEVVANVRFNQVHQDIVFALTQAYHAQLAAATKLRAATQALRAAEGILDAASTRLERGVGTRLELAAAREQQARSALSKVQAEGELAAARVALNAALGLEQGSRVELRPPDRPLPSPASASLEALLRDAIARRPDITAAVAELRAAEAAARATEASYLPKLGLIAGLSTSENQFRFNGGQTLGTPLDQTGVLLGLSVPLYQGGERQSRIRGALSRIEQARSDIASLRELAAREIATAYEALRTALAACDSAEALVQATRTTADAARKAVEVGIGDITEAARAEQALLSARQLRADARRDAFDAAAALALATAALPVAPAG